MPGGRDTEEFQQFFKSLIQPKAPAESPAGAFGVRDVIINGPVRCKIYIGMPHGVPASQPSEAPAKPPAKP